jgi:hypothetical protein
MSNGYAVESRPRRWGLTKKKTWKQRLRDWLNDENEGEAIVSIGIDSVSNSLDSNESIRFSVYRASGGLIVETRKYDHRKDQNNHQLHIITDDKNLGTELAKIITLEALRG